MAKKFEPLADTCPSMSPAKRKWLESKVKMASGRLASRQCLFLNVVTTTMREHGSVDQTICDGYIENGYSKLHDKEPSILVRELEDRASTFFDGTPGRGALTLEKKRALVGELMKHLIALGRTGYGKPNLRKAGDTETATDLAVL